MGVERLTSAVLFRLAPDAPPIHLTRLLLPGALGALAVSPTDLSD
jgi:hypothetical protein